MEIRELGHKDVTLWAELRMQLWPEEDLNQHKIEIMKGLEVSGLISLGAIERGKLIGLIEVSLRNIVDGCLSSPVVYIEGWVVHRDHRRKGLGKELLEHAKRWGRSKGCTEMGSDTEIERMDSIGIHKKLGFEEVDRVVNFRMKI